MSGLSWDRMSGLSGECEPIFPSFRTYPSFNWTYPSLSEFTRVLPGLIRVFIRLIRVVSEFTRVLTGRTRVVSELTRVVSEWRTLDPQHWLQTVWQPGLVVRRYRQGSGRLARTLGLNEALQTVNIGFKGSEEKSCLYHHLIHYSVWNWD